MGATGEQQPLVEAVYLISLFRRRYLRASGAVWIISGAQKILLMSSVRRIAFALHVLFFKCDTTI